MSVYQQGFLTPPQESEELYPYGRVWGNAIIEGIILLGIVAGIYALIVLLGIDVPPVLQQYINIVLCLTPFGLWLIFSWRTEQAVPEPRKRLLPVALITALMANALGIPIIENLLRVDSWLPLTTAITRIIGYAFTVGLVQEVTKYFVIRFTVWPTFFRIRVDGPAYAIACAVGYTTAQNLHLISASSSIHIDALAIRVLANFTIQFSTSIIVGYGLAEVWLGKPNYLFLTGALAAASFLSGLVIPLRAGLVNSIFTLEVTAPRPLLNLGFSILVYASSLLIITFLISNAERKTQESVGDVEERYSIG